jgi:hypothetical protein
MTVHRRCRYGIVLHQCAPSPDQHIVVTSVDGARADMCPVADFGRAVRLAVRIASIKGNWPVVVKVQCWHMRDLMYSLGVIPSDLSISRDEVVATLKEAVREAPQPGVRYQASQLLNKLGVIR